jgi:hypothetical protein
MKNLERVCAQYNKMSDEYGLPVKQSRPSKYFPKKELNTSPEWDVDSPLNCLNILKRYVKNLSLTFDEQNQSLIENLSDYLTIDIATEWEYFIFESSINVLLREKKIDQNVVELFKTIIRRFDNVSFKEAEKDVWTLEGFKNHPFWIEQRKLAKELLTLLENVEIEEKL